MSNAMGVATVVAMGLYDLVTVSASWCQCSEGHDLCDEPLQTKDLGETMGAWFLDEELRGEPGNYGAAVVMPLSGTVSLYTFCRKCPSFVQTGTWNVLAVWVEFTVDLDGGYVTSAHRVSPSTAEWSDAELAVGSIGPLTFERAIEECRSRRASER
jgi:hypothetical protein